MKIVFVLLLAAACVLSGASTILAVGWIGIISASNSTNSAATPADGNDKAYILRLIPLAIVHLILTGLALLLIIRTIRPIAKLSRLPWILRNHHRITFAFVVTGVLAAIGAGYSLAGLAFDHWRSCQSNLSSNAQCVLGESGNTALVVSAIVWVTLAIINGIALALVAEKGAVVPWFIPPPQIYESSIESGSSGSKMSHLKNALNFPKAVAETYGRTQRLHQYSEPPVPILTPDPSSNMPPAPSSSSSKTKHPAQDCGNTSVPATSPSPATTAITSNTAAASSSSSSNDQQANKKQAKPVVDRHSMVSDYEPSDIEPEPASIQHRPTKSKASRVTGISVAESTAPRTKSYNLREAYARLESKITRYLSQDLAGKHRAKQQQKQHQQQQQQQQSLKTVKMTAQNQPSVSQTSQPVFLTAPSESQEYVNEIQWSQPARPSQITHSISNTQDSVIESPRLTQQRLQQSQSSDIEDATMLIIYDPTTSHHPSMPPLPSGRATTTSSATPDIANGRQSSFFSYFKHQPPVIPKTPASDLRLSSIDFKSELSFDRPYN